MEKPISAQLSPSLVTLVAGRTYLWCSCGRSRKQPFCDGSHRGTGIEPMRYVATRSEEVLLCGCKHTAAPPFCDGAHNNLPGGAPLDDPHSDENRAFSIVAQQLGARTMLNGDCYIISPARVSMSTRGALRYCDLISSGLGAQYQAQMLLEIDEGVSPVFGFGDCDVILFTGAGAGTVTISGRSFDVQATDGVYVRPGEGLQLTPHGGTLQMFASACPLGEIAWPAQMPDNFDSRYPQRIASVDADQRNAMGPRYFQCLADKRIGSNVITQFIGHIPASKATPHRHLYEESLIILSGSGWVWTDDCKARITAGDVIFLPRKQLHSLQATSADGMDVVGVIYPGDNPSINYY